MISCLQLIAFTQKGSALLDEELNNLVLGLANDYDEDPEQFILMLHAMVIEPHIDKAYSLFKAADLLSNRHYYNLSLKAWEYSRIYYEMVDDKHSQSLCLINIGNDYSRLEQFESALDSYKKAVNIALENGYKDVELKCYASIGVTYYQSARYEMAIKYYKKAVNLALENGDKEIELIGYNSIAASYDKLNDHQRSREFHQKAKNLI